MAQRRYLSTGEKVRELVRLFGSKGAVVQALGATSKSSLKRWVRRECKPLAAHVILVNDAYGMAKRISGPLVRNLRRETETRLQMGKLKQGAKRNRRK